MAALAGSPTLDHSLAFRRGMCALASLPALRCVPDLQEPGGDSVLALAAQQTATPSDLLLTPVWPSPKFHNENRKKELEFQVNPK